MKEPFHLYSITLFIAFKLSPTKILLTIIILLSDQIFDIPSALKF